MPSVVPGRLRQKDLNDSMSIVVYWLVLLFKDDVLAFCGCYFYKVINVWLILGDE
jgi:hypothetical protein